jgi:hypothetical protein
VVFIPLTLAAALALTGQPTAEHGTIRGRVVNLSQGEQPCPQTEVLLRALVDGQFAPVAKTTTDEHGNYQFTELPVGAGHVFLPGANCKEIHYPGRRVQLTRGHPTAYVTLEVRDTVAEPCPLVIRQQEVVIRTEPGAVHVVEALLVDNPTSKTFVGRAENGDSSPVTLRLGIPADFERVTFETESFGRQFVLSGGRLITNMPWMPGQRWLRFTYTLRNEDTQRVWQRVLDAPCESLCVRVQHAKLDEVDCNLTLASSRRSGEKVFESHEEVLPAGHMVSVNLGALPIPWSVYARWTALLVLGVLVVGTALLLRRVRRTDMCASAANTPQPEARLAGLHFDRPDRERAHGQCRRATVR